MKVNWNWGAFFASLAKAAGDVKANTPPKPPASMTGADIAAELKRLAPALTADLAWLAAHEGVITAADDLLLLFEQRGFAWATTLRDAIDAAPGVGAQVVSWLPLIAEFLAATTPTPQFDASGAGPQQGAFAEHGR